MLWIAGAVILILVLSQMLAGGGAYKTIKTSEALAQLNSNNVTKAVIHDKEQTIDLDLKTPFNGKTKVSASYPADATLNIFNTASSKVGTGGLDTKISHQSALVSILLSLLPILLIAGVLFFVMSNLQGGGSKVMSFGRSKAKLVSKDTPKNTFADVAGADEAIEELQEI
jgi:cell division protease FtsH